MLIGLYSSQSGSGKDTVGIHLRDRWGFEIFSFCSELRRCVAPSFDDAPAQYLSESGFIAPDKEWEMSSGFQDELIRRSKEFRPRVLKTGSQYIEDAIALGRSLVVVDIRRQPEFDTIIDNDGEMIRIHRKSCSRPKASLDGLLDKQKFDWNIHNDGNLEDLNHLVDLMMSDYVAFRGVA